MTSILHITTSLLFSTLILEAHTWKNTNGDIVNAEYISSDKNNVTLKRKSDGKQFTLSLSKLSAEDQEYISTLATSKNNNKKSPTSFTDNFKDEWPDLIKLEKNFTIEQVDSPDNSFIYQSKHFRFVSDVRLSISVVRRFAEIFEATLQYMQILPISSQKAIHHTDKNRKLILLFAKESDYQKAGGPAGSAGVYMRSGTQERIMVAMKNLGLKEHGSGFTLDRSKSNKTLPHEITHMFTDPVYYAHGSLGWFTEGLAEYVGVTPYRGGIYSVRSNRRDIIEYVTAYGNDNSGGRNIGKNIKVGPLKDFFLMSYADFVKNGNKNYGIGTLLVYYFFHFDEKGNRVNINNFLQALQDNKTGEEALKALQGKRTMQELEEDIAEAWRTRQIKLDFSK